jgi:hypothetical protein
MLTGNTGSTGITRSVQLIGPVLGAMLMIGCARTEGTTDERSAQQAEKKAEAPAQATVSISGCVEVAPGPRRYVLRNVRFEPRETGDPHIDTTTAGAHGITEGSWIRLRSAEQDLGPQAGRRVTILGAITDDGRNTIGTAGTHGVKTPSGDVSQAPSSKHHSEKVKTEAGRIARESMANGTAAEVEVQKVLASGDKCPLEVSPADR